MLTCYLNKCNVKSVSRTFGQSIQHGFVAKPFPLRLERTEKPLEIRLS